MLQAVQQQRLCWHGRSTLRLQGAMPAELLADVASSQLCRGVDILQRAVCCLGMTTS
jgi:hypothetical protein